MIKKIKFNKNYFLIFLFIQIDKIVQNLIIRYKTKTYKV